MADFLEADWYKKYILVTNQSFRFKLLKTYQASLLWNSHWQWYAFKYIFKI